MDPVTIENQATLLYNNVTTNSNTAVTRILSLYDLTATKEHFLTRILQDKPLPMSQELKIQAVPLFIILPL